MTLLSEFQIVMFGRSAVLGALEREPEHTYRPTVEAGDLMCLGVLGTLFALFWVEKRWPHLALEKFSEQEWPELPAGVPHFTGWRITFEDDEQAGAFAARWVKPPVEAAYLAF